MCMNTATSRSKAPVKLALMAFMALLITVCVSLALGTTAAYADGTSDQSTQSNTSITARAQQSYPQDIPTAPASNLTATEADITSPQEDPLPTTSSERVLTTASNETETQEAAPTQPAANAAPAPVASNSNLTSEDSSAPTSQDCIATSASTQNPTVNGTEMTAAASDLSAAASTYPGDNKTDDIFVGIAADGYYTGETRDEDNGVSVYVQVDACTGFYFAAIVEYLRIGTTVFDSRAGYSHNNIDASWSTTTADGKTTSTTEDDLMMNWYYGPNVPLPQGMYYTSFNNEDPGSSAGSGIDSGTVHYNVNPQAFVGTFAMSNWVENRMTFQTAWLNSSSEGNYSMSLPLPFNIGSGGTGNYMGYGMNDILYFEHEGSHIFTAQFTYVQEVSQTVDGVEYISYRVAVSNPVRFFITVRPKDTVEIVFDVKDDSGNPVDVTDGNFKVGLDRSITDEYGYIMGMYNIIYPYSYFTSSSLSYDYGTPDEYQLTIEHINGIFAKYAKTFTLSQDDYEAALAGDKKITWSVTLERLAPDQHTVTFYAEDGTTILQVEDSDGSGGTVLVDSKQYNEGTLYDEITRPKTIPVKPEDDDYVYVFSNWTKRGSTTTTGVTDVTGDTDYIAVYRGIAKHVEPTVQKVYATGGLLGKKPESVLAYEFEYRELSDDQKNGIMESYSSDIGGNDVVAIFEVSLTQYNKNGSSTQVSEGVGDLTLSFDVSAAPGIVEGAKVKVIQIHTATDNSIEKYAHRGLVVSGGKVNVTLNDKLSTFIITTDDEYEDPTTDPTDDPTNPTGQETDPTDPTDNPTQGGDNPTDPTDDPTTDPEPGVTGDPTAEPTAEPDPDPEPVAGPEEQSDPAPAEEPAGPTQADVPASEPEATSTESTPAENPVNLQGAVNNGAESLANSLSSILPAANTEDAQPMVHTGGDANADKPSDTGDASGLAAYALLAFLTLGGAYALRRRQES